MFYKIPPEVAEREKVIGGFLDLGQIIWLVIGLAIAALTFISTFAIFGSKGSLFISLFPIGVSLIFVFYKKEGLSYFTYLRYNWKHNQKTHYLPNVRTEREYVVLDKEDEDLFI